MTSYREDIENLDLRLGSLEGNISAAAAATERFQSELANMRGSLTLAEREARGLSRSMSTGLRGAFSDMILEGAKLSDVLENVARSMIRSTFRQAVTPVTDAISGVVTGGIRSILGGILPNAQGNAFAGGRVTPFARGGVVDGPTHFAMRGGLGLMGEAGPEAIMPLSRGPDGALGVRAAGSAPVTVNMTVHARDAESFRRSKTQIAAGVSRAIQRGSRNT